MAACPQCGKIYGDDMRFCLDDGTPLTGSDPITERPTAQFPASETQARVPAATSVGANPSEPTLISHRTNRSSRVPLLIGGLLLLAGVGLVTLAAGAGIWFYVSSRSTPPEELVDAKGPELASPSPPPFDVGMPLPNPVNQSPTPTPTATPKTEMGNDDVADEDERTVVAKPIDDEIVSEPEPPPPVIERKAPTNTTNPRVPKIVSAGVVNGRATNLPKPPYPPAARAVRATGAVTVQVMVAEDGRVITANAVSGHPLLRAAAVQAARGASFRPMILSGQPVRFTGVIMYNFAP